MLVKGAKGIFGLLHYLIPVLANCWNWIAYVLLKANQGEYFIILHRLHTKKPSLVKRCNVFDTVTFFPLRKQNLYFVCSHFLVKIFSCPGDYTLWLVLFSNKNSQWLPNTPFASISECLVSQLCLGYEHEGHMDPILVKHELNMLSNLRSV